MAALTRGKVTSRTSRLDLPLPPQENRHSNQKPSQPYGTTSYRPLEPKCFINGSPDVHRMEWSSRRLQRECQVYAVEIQKGSELWKQNFINVRFLMFPWKYQLLCRAPPAEQIKNQGGIVVVVILNPLASPIGHKLK